MDEELVEEVAEALYLTEYELNEAYPGEAKKTWRRYTDHSSIRSRYLRLARAAILAIDPNANKPPLTRDELLELNVYPSLT